MPLERQRWMPDLSAGFYALETAIDGAKKRERYDGISMK
jgi:hypothetical protein